MIIKFSAYNRYFWPRGFEFDETDSKQKEMGTMLVGESSESGLIDKTFCSVTGECVFPNYMKLMRLRIDSDII